MFDWEGCPLGLFDLYMEVGDVKAEAAGDGSVGIEIWIGSCRAKEFTRPECAEIRRRPIYGVMKQILKLSGEREVRLVFLCDDIESWGNDTENQSGAIYLLLRELKKLGKPIHTTLYTRKSRAQIALRSESFGSSRDKTEYDGLYEILDVLVTEQANPYTRTPR